MTVMDGDGKHYSVDVNADSSYDAAHLYLTHVRGNPSCVSHPDDLDRIRGRDGRAHSLCPGRTAEEMDREPAAGMERPSGMLYRQRPMIGD